MVPFQRHLVIYPRLILENLKSSHGVRYILLYHFINERPNFQFKKEVKEYHQKTKKYLIEYRMYKKIREKNV